MRESHGDRVNPRNAWGSAADASLQESVDEAIVTPIAAREKAARSLLDDLLNGGTTLGVAVDASFPGGRLCNSCGNHCRGSKRHRQLPGRARNAPRIRSTRAYQENVDVANVTRIAASSNAAGSVLKSPLSTGGTPGVGVNLSFPG